MRSDHKGNRPAVYSTHHRWEFRVAFVVAVMFSQDVLADDTTAVVERLVHRYHDTASYQASGTALVIKHQGQNKPFAETFETFDIALQRDRGIKASEHRKSSGALTIDHTSWGPLTAIQSYREDRIQGFLVTVVTRSPTQRPDGFAEFFTGASGTPAVWVIGGLLVDGKLPNLGGNEGELRVENSNGAVVLVQTVGQATSAVERRLTLDPDGSLVRIQAHDSGSDVDIHFNRQTFDEPLAADSLSFAAPDYAPGFDRSSKLTEDEKRALMEQLANAGNKDARIHVLLNRPLKPGQVPDPETFKDIVRRLEEAEKLEFGYAYVLHGQLFQSDNRNWFPPEVRKLSGAQIRRRQRAIFMQGAEQCSGEAEFALRKVANPPLTVAEEAILKRTGEACFERFQPPELKEAQAALDRP